MESFGQLYEHMYEGSMVGLGAATFAVMGMCIAKAKPPEFVVTLNPSLVSVILGESVETVEAAIAKLCAPDVKSRNKNDEGRRLKKVGEYDYYVINASFYRGLSKKQLLNLQASERMRRMRDKKNVTHENVTYRNPLILSASVPKEGECEGKVYSPESRVALHFLNELTGQKFREREASLGIINARLSEPDVDIDGVKRMIMRQVKLWKGDFKMERFLRPSTLFGKEKFNEYYAARDLPINEASKYPNGKIPYSEKSILERQIDKEYELAMLSRGKSPV